MSARSFPFVVVVLALTLPILAACDNADPVTCTDTFPLTMVSDTPGTGQQVGQGSTVVVEYKGTLENGSVFDSTRAGAPACFSLGRTIPGFRFGIGGVTLTGENGPTVIPPMRLGGERTLRIPPNLAYGPASRTGIPSCSALTFEIRLVDAPNGC